MAILNFQVGSIGETGVVPKLLYLNTDSTIEEVTTTGYLNNIVAQGNAISNTDMALAITRATPDTRTPVCYFYQVSFSDGNWSLVPISSGSGFNPASDYAPTGSWDFTGPFTVEAGSGDVVLQSDTGDIALLAPNSGSTANITGDTVIVQGNTAINLESATIQLPDLAELTASDVIYYDSGTGLLTYGAVPGFDTAGTYVLTGGWLFTASFSINTSSDINMASSGQYFLQTSGLITLSTNSGAAIHITSGQQTVLTSVNATSITATGGNLVLSAPSGGTSLQLNSNITTSTAATLIQVNTPSYSLSASTIQFSNLPGTPPGGSVAVMWDPSTQNLYHA